MLDDPGNVPRPVVHDPAIGDQSEIVPLADRLAHQCIGFIR